jgi:hypothetical protein
MINIAVALMVVVALVVVLIVRPEKTVSRSARTTTTLPCASA